LRGGRRRWNLPAGQRKGPGRVRDGGTDRVAGRKAPPALAAHLAPGERVLWHGVPAAGGLLHAGHAAAFAICLGIAIGLPLLVAAGNPRGAPELGIALGIGLAFVAIPSALMLRLLWRARGTVYALTDRRLLTVAGGRWLEMTAEAPAEAGRLRAALAALRATLRPA
jgi:hypothetical protein